MDNSMRYNYLNISKNRIMFIINTGKGVDAFFVTVPKML